jgi:DNA polymerase-3 subunit epsilon
MSQKIVAIIDIETTGVNPESDRIVEFAVQKGLTGDDFHHAWRINPGIPIPAQATAVHGISDDDVKDSPPFSALVPVIKKIIAGADVIVGYNLEFDLKCINAELKRAGEPQLDLSEKVVVDPLQIWRHFEPRRLEDAVRRFVGEEHTDAHTAEGDVAATGKVLIGMLKAFGLQDLSWEEMRDILEPDRSSWVGPSHHLRLSGDEIVINFGRNAGRSLHQIGQEDVSYLNWILGSDFPSHVKEIVAKAKELKAEEFRNWAAEHYPMRG